MRLVVGEFFNWDAAYREGQRMHDSGQVKEFFVVYLPYAAELNSFAELVDKTYSVMCSRTLSMPTGS